jgi:hypothetical protein
LTPDELVKEEPVIRGSRSYGAVGGEAANAGGVDPDDLAGQGIRVSRLHSHSHSHIQPQSVMLEGPASQHVRIHDCRVE